MKTGLKTTITETDKERMRLASRIPDSMMEEVPVLNFRWMFIPLAEESCAHCETPRRFLSKCFSNDGSY